MYSCLSKGIRANGNANGLIQNLNWFHFLWMITITLTLDSLWLYHFLMNQEILKQEFARKLLVLYVFLFKKCYFMLITHCIETALSIGLRIFGLYPIQSGKTLFKKRGCLGMTLNCTWNTLSLPSFPGPLWPNMVLPVRILYMG